MVEPPSSPHTNPSLLARHCCRLPRGLLCPGLSLPPMKSRFCTLPSRPSQSSLALRSHTTASLGTPSPLGTPVVFAWAPTPEGGCGRAGSHNGPTNSQVDQIADTPEQPERPLAPTPVAEFGEQGSRSPSPCWWGNLSPIPFLTSQNSSATPTLRR